MPSEKLARILRARSGLTAEEIAALTESEGWAWVYAHAGPRKEKLPEICFTGFSQDEKDGLVEAAAKSGFKVVTDVTRQLSFLCVGENAGPSKLKKASAQGVIFLSREQFQHLLETGEVPSSPS